MDLTQVTEDTLPAFLDACMETLLARNTRMADRWDLETMEEWNFDQADGLLRFRWSDGRAAVAPAQIAGSFDAGQGTWQWAWANHSIDEALARAAAELRDMALRSGVPELASAVLEADEDLCWQLSAVLLDQSGGAGVFRGPAGPSSYVFFVYQEPRAAGQH